MVLIITGSYITPTQEVEAAEETEVIDWDASLVMDEWSYIHDCSWHTSREAYWGANSTGLYSKINCGNTSAIYIQDKIVTKNSKFETTVWADTDNDYIGIMMNAHRSGNRLYGYLWCIGSPYPSDDVCENQQAPQTGLMVMRGWNGYFGWEEDEDGDRYTPGIESNWYSAALNGPTGLRLPDDNSARHYQNPDGYGHVAEEDNDLPDKGEWCSNYKYNLTMEVINIERCPNGRNASGIPCVEIITTAQELVINPQTGIYEALQRPSRAVTHIHSKDNPEHIFLSGSVGILDCSQPSAHFESPTIEGTVIEGRGNSVTYKVNGGNGSDVVQKKVPFGSNPYTLYNGSGFSRPNYVLLGWSRNANATVPEFDLGETVTNFIGEKDKVILYALWCPGYWIQYNPNSGLGIIPTDFFNWNTWNNLQTKTFNKVGYTQEGWSYSSGLNTPKDFTLGQLVYNLTQPGKTVTLYAWWRPNTYTITWDSNNGTGEEYSPGTVYQYDQSYSAISPSVSGFEKQGYYIKYWQRNQHSGARYYCNPKFPAGTDSIQEKFKNLTSIDKANVRLYAAWEPIQYTIRIWDNYENSPEYKDYVVKYDEKFSLPSALWSHGSAKMLGYDYNKDSIATSSMKVGDVLMNLTDIDGVIINIYTIWDNPPKITSPASIDLPREIAAGHKINVSNGTISRSDIEEFLLRYATATDVEYTSRYNSSTVPAGLNHGYTVRVISIDPVEISNNASDHVTTYGVMFQIIDDAGQIATCTTSLFVGDNFDILIH